MPTGQPWARIARAAALAHGALARAAALAHGARLIAIAAAACVVALVACEEERTQYLYRPGFMRQPGDEAGFALADGTKVKFLDAPLSDPSRQGQEIRGPEEPKPPTYPEVFVTGVEAKTPPPPPPPPEPILLREEHKDGTVTLRAFTAEQALGHFVFALKQSEYRPFYDQMLSAQARRAFEAQGGYAAFAAWCGRNRAPALETLNRMGFGLHNSDVVLERTGSGLRARLSPRAEQACRYHELLMSVEGGLVRVDGLQ